MFSWVSRLLCLGALVVVAPFAQAQIYHCIGPHGEQEFTDQPCATPVSAPLSLPLASPSRDSSAPVDTGFGNVCPGSPTGLRLAVSNAFDTRDVNSLAGLILWRGIGQRAAIDRLRSLKAWLKQPLADIALVRGAGLPYAEDAVSPESESADDGQAVVIAPQAALPVGLRVSTGGDEGRTRDFGVTESGGCWWLTF